MSFKIKNWILISVLGFMIGLLAVIAGLFADRFGIIGFHRILLILYGVGLASASAAVGFITALNPKKWPFGIELGLIIMVVILITGRSLVPFIKSVPSRVFGDADGYIPYAVYLSGHQIPIPEISLVRDLDSYNPYLTYLSVAFSPDGKAIASASGDGIVRLWDYNGNPIGKPFLSHKDSVISVAFSLDDKIIISSSEDRAVRLWDVYGNPVGQLLHGHDGAVTSVAFSPDGRIIATGSEDRTIRLWDIHGNLVGQPLYGHEGSVTSVAFSPDGQTIVSGSKDGFVRLWDCQDNFVSRRLGTGSYATDFVSFSPDGKIIAIGSNNGIVRLWNVHGNPIGMPFVGHKSSVTSVAFSPDGKTIASASRDGTIRLWDYHGNQIVRPFRGNKNAVIVTLPSLIRDYFRQPGYPLILSIFMRITGQYNACAAEICQPVILALLIILSIIWVRRRFGIVYAVALAIPFLDPTNDMIKISSFDFPDLLLAILFFVVALLLYRTVLFKGKIRYNFLFWFIVTFLVSGIKMIVSVLVIFLCFSAFFVLCGAKLSKRVWAERYNLTLISKRLFLIVLSAIIIFILHGYISPGSAIYNKQAVLAMCYWSPASNIKDSLMHKIKRMQKLADEKLPSAYKSYSGAGLITATGSWPPIYPYLPVVCNLPPALIDPNNNQVLRISTKEVERGAYLLMRANLLPFVIVGAKHFMKDYKNLFSFSRAGREYFLYGLICIVFLLAGVFSLYKRNSLVTSSICVAYILFFAFLSLVSIPAIRLLLPFSLFYYIAFVTGAVSVVKKSIGYLNKTRQRSCAE